MPATARKQAAVLYGSERARLAPPTPVRSDLAKYQATATEIGIALRPWQCFAGRYIYALGPTGWLYPEIAVLVARQQGKTTLLKPHIIERLRMGRRILHAAQTRELPRLLFFELAPMVESLFGTKAKVRRGAGQETIEIEGGAFYKIVAATGGAPRGYTLDDLLLDEARELDEEFIDAVIPTTMASPDPQIVYLSNAGTANTTALNSLRARAMDNDPALAWLEWSAAPGRPASDRVGWAEANPSMGHVPSTEPALERHFRSHTLAGTLGAFETENLCRWAITTSASLVDPATWSARRADIGKPVRPAIGVSLDPEGMRASIALAWRSGDIICLRVAEDATGSPVDTDAIRDRVHRLSATHAAVVAYDQQTDAELVKGLRKGRSVPINGSKFSAASAQFVNLVNVGHLAWSEATVVSDDLTWTVRKQDGDQGSFHAVRSDEHHPIPAALAAIRAVYLASYPRPASAPRFR